MKYFRIFCCLLSIVLAIPCVIFSLREQSAFWGIWALIMIIIHLETARDYSDKINEVNHPKAR